jgi:sulfoxide reductase heme-binding subunit YedZ
MTDALWYLGRGTGVVSLIMLSVTVALGVGSRAGRPAFGLPRFAVARVHRNAALLACVLLTVHIVSMLFDPYAQLTPLDVIVPFGAAYRPLWIGLGTLALDLVAAVVVTSLLRHRIGARTWRILHWLTYGLWPLAVLHGLFAGSDAGAPWFLAMAATCVGVVLAAAGWRLRMARPQMSLGRAS